MGQRIKGFLFFIIIIFITAGCSNDFLSDIKGVVNNEKTTDSVSCWVKSYGGSRWDKTASIIETADNGYLLTGLTWSFDVDADDAWLLKLDEKGAVEWQKTTVVQIVIQLVLLIPAACGGYLAVFYTESFGGGQFSSSNFWLVKLRSDGSAELQKTFGGDYTDKPVSAIAVSDEGYLIAGTTRSYVDGGIAAERSNDFVLLKINNNLSIDWQKPTEGRKMM